VPRKWLLSVSLVQGQQLLRLNCNGDTFRLKSSFKNCFVMNSSWRVRIYLELKNWRGFLGAVMHKDLFSYLNNFQ